jgi:hypothetical protein
MASNEEELIKLRRIYKQAEPWDECGQPLVYLPNVTVESGGVKHELNTLLCPRARDGYPTRVFLSKPFPNKGQNWKVFNIKGLTWHACSFSEVPASLPWIEILANHLRVLR